MKRSTQLALGVLTAAAMMCAMSPSRMLSPPSHLRHTSLELSRSQQETNELRVRFMGVTTILLDDGETAIMTDGFFSRPGWLQLLFLRIEPDQERIDYALRRVGIRRLAAVLVAHSHHDHVMDSAVVAKHTGALLIGSESTANVGRGGGLPNDAIRIIEDKPFNLGRFKVTAYQSPHSPGALYPGEINAPLFPPARSSAYREGGNYSFLIEHSGRVILIHPSANFRPGMYEGVDADVVLLGIGRLGKQDDKFADIYWGEVVQTTRAKLVIPIHWDNFMISLDKPLQPMPSLLDDFNRGMEMIRIRAEKDQVVVRLMPVFEPVDVLTIAPRRTPFEQSKRLPAN